MQPKETSTTQTIQQPSSLSGNPTPLFYTTGVTVALLAAFVGYVLVKLPTRGAVKPNEKPKKKSKAKKAAPEKEEEQDDSDEETDDSDEESAEEPKKAAPEKDEKADEDKKDDEKDE